MAIDIGTPEVLKNVSTEPEAAHLRNVLRRIQQIGSNDSYDVLVTIVGICRDALKRPRTNGGVIDQLVKENGDLQSEIVDLQARARMASQAPPEESEPE